MAQTGTINDLLNKDKLDGPEEEALAARNLRQARRGGISEGDSSLDNLISLAGGLGGMGAAGRVGGGLKKDNLGRPVRPERPLPAGRQSQVGGDSSGSGQTGPGGGGEPAFAGGQPSFAKATEGKPMGAGSDLDSRLMAARLREEKNKERERREGEGEKGKEGGEKGEEAEGSPEKEETKKGEGGLRDRIGQLKEKANLKKRAQKKIEEKVTAPAKEGTNWLLRWAWTTLIPSFGLSLFYINLHVFLRMVLGDKLFCKLGEEWIPKGAQALTGEAGKTGGKAIGLVEVIGLLILDLVALTIIGGALALIVMIVDFMEKGVLGKAGAVIGGLTGLGWSGVKALFDLF